MRRAALAADAGLPARLLDAGAAAALAPRLVDPARCTAALLHPEDGTARAGVLTSAVGAARALSRVLRDLYPGVPDLDALAPDRFADVPDPDLTTRALTRYRDVCATAPRR